MMWAKYELERIRIRNEKFNQGGHMGICKKCGEETLVDDGELCFCCCLSDSLELFETESEKIVKRLENLETKKQEEIDMENNKTKKGMFGMDMSKMMSGFNMRTLGEDEVAMGMDGKTYFKRKNGDYVRYDAESRTIVNTHNMKFDFGMAMIIPSPTVQAGDMIVNGEDFVYITSIKDNKIFGVGLNSGRTKSIIVEKSTMGFSFYQKVVNMMDGMGQQTGGMFGGMNPMMLMMMNKEEGKSSGGMMEMMMMSQMMGGNNMFAQPQITQPIVTNNVVAQEPMTDDEIEAEIERLKNMKTK
jgi:hypothetical protein